VPFGTVLLVHGPDLLLMTVACALVRMEAVGGRTASFVPIGTEMRPSGTAFLVCGLDHALMLVV